MALEARLALHKHKQQQGVVLAAAEKALCHRTLQRYLMTLEGGEGEGEGCVWRE